MTLSDTADRLLDRVGDFGLAFVTSQTDETNPSMRNSTGTPGFMASEQREYRDSMTKQPIDVRIRYGDSGVISRTGLTGFTTASEDSLRV